MGNTTTIFGFVECAEKHVISNRLIICNFHYDPIFPFTNCFGNFFPAYRGSSMPFSSNYKAFSQSDQNEWFKNFEGLLNLLNFTAAAVAIESDSNSNRLLRDYISIGESFDVFEATVQNN